MELDFSDEYKNGRRVCEKTHLDLPIDNWPVVEPQNPSVCRVPDFHAVHPEYLVRDISKKNVQIFWSKKLDNNCFYSFDTAACIFPSKACLERCGFQTPLSSPKEPSLELKKNLCFQFIQVGVKRYKICNIETFSLISRLFLINGNTWCAFLGDRQPKSQEEQPEKYKNTKRHWLNIYWNAFQWMAWNLSNPAWAI